MSKIGVAVGEDFPVEEGGAACKHDDACGRHGAFGRWGGRGIGRRGHRGFGRGRHHGWGFAAADRHRHFAVLMLVLAAVFAAFAAGKR